MASSLLNETTTPSKAADRVEIAVIWVQKAQTGSLMWTDSCTEEQLQAYRLKKWMKPVTNAVKYLLLGIAIVEVPSYCLLDREHCPGPGNAKLHSMAWAPMLPPSVTNALAICFWVYFGFHLGLRRKALGEVHTMTMWHILGTFLVVLGFADCVYAVFTGTGILFWSSFRISRVARPLIFLCYTKPVRGAATRILLSVPKIMDVFVSLAICILFFSWLGLVLFAESTEGKTFFSNWQQAITNLYILFTTANCPDVFLPAYEKHPMYFIFFGVFLIITLYLLSNVLLASVYDAYKEQLKDMLKDFYKNQATAIEHAFTLLADDRGMIRMDCWSKFFACMCNSSTGAHNLEHSDDATYNRQRANQIFMLMDKDDNHGIDLGEFKLLLSVIHGPDVYIPRQPPPDMSTPFEQFMKSLFQEGIDLPGGNRMSWDTLVDCVICVDVLAVLYQTILFVNGDGRFETMALNTHHVWFWALFLFSCFYVMTVSLKIWVFGLERFWNIKPVQNRYDFFSVYFIFAMEVICLGFDFGPGRDAPLSLLRVVVILHITRALRLLPYIQPLKYIASFVVRLAPTYYRMGMLLVTVFYMYAMIGGQFFGGLIYDSNPALLGTEYASSKYWTMNFNSFPNSMVTLFVLMVVNNWFIITDAFMKVSGTKWAAAFFISFFMIVNMVVLNILMALLLECSAVVREEMEKQGSKQVEQGYEAVLRSVLLADEKVQEDPELPMSGSQPVESYGSVERGVPARHRRATTNAVPLRRGTQQL